MTRPDAARPRERPIALIGVASCAGTVVVAVLAFLSCSGPPRARNPIAAPLSGPETSFADAEELAASMRADLGPGYEVRVRLPFVIGGRSGDPTAEALAETLDSSMAALRRQFIDTPPSRTLRVYLFEDPEAYTDYCRRRRSEEPPSRFGFFVPASRQLILDASTGGGTLIHELVHALMLDDFPNSPKWFDEGFASLFEQSSLRDGRIRGLPNWRLPELQKALADGKTIPLTGLFSAGHGDFDGAQRGLLYAEARYLCLYLQERGWLEAYYRKFRGDCARDPTGSATLRSVTGQELEALEAEYFQWARGIRR
ncbi:MAG: hypothetical protein HYY93_05175 [Planctomycetes bacterium]|nr:hypothetical protein [Planctomycetota bacterium]